jgi:hypothetical protein
LPLNILPRPAANIPENKNFNYHVSKIRVRSEHCIGYLKGRFQSLRGLRVRIQNSQDIRRASAWIISCICIHNFVLDLEYPEDDQDMTVDKFFRDGIRILHQERLERVRWKARLEAQARVEERNRTRAREVELQHAKTFRERLKHDLQDNHADT